MVTYLPQECVMCLNEESSEKLITYNHCGLYYIHKSCLEKWKNEECIICREKVIIHERCEEKYKTILKYGLSLTLFSGILLLLILI
jgi:hypothetical protein